jgi:DNA modification methylase
VTETISFPISKIRFVKELYPRLREDDAAIERYRDALEKLPPITIARDGVLVDGFHRWQAYLREEKTEIPAENLGNLSDSEILREAYQRNATHGHQLTRADKERAACHLFDHVPGTDTERYDEISKLLSVSPKTAERYTRPARKERQTKQKERARDLWLDCLTQQEIADAIRVPRKTISDWLADSDWQSDFAKVPESRQHFDVWNFQMPPGSNISFFGRMPPQVVENLLWLYTEPGQVIFDPFAGSGTTIDAAKRMGRRVWASDRKPSTPTLPIHKHDITTGWPDNAPNKVDFVLLDPPYWMQAKGRYSDDPEDLGNQDLETFLKSWLKTVGEFRKHLNDAGYLAFIVSPAEDKANDEVIDLAYRMYETCVGCGFKNHRRIIVTYNTQQATGQQVEWARDGKKLLKLYRDLVVMRL